MVVVGGCSSNTQNCGLVIIACIIAGPSTAGLPVRGGAPAACKSAGDLFVAALEEGRTHLPPVVNHKDGHARVEARCYEGVGAARYDPSTCLP